MNIKYGVIVAAIVCLSGEMAVFATPKDARNNQKARASGVATIQVASSAFKDGQPIPKEFTGDGKDVSPPLSWNSVPAKTASLAVICVDPDAPTGDWYHWILFNIPSGTRKLDQSVSKLPALKDGSQHGTNDFHKIGYNGPAPPPGALHHYRFTVFALDNTLKLGSKTTGSEFLKAVKGHVLGQGHTVATYKR
jgi:Raf kinase inhibitor-like YbhB/YbcL family protein